jgi:hypothetical protein
MSIADTGRFWEILVIPVLQILENTGNTSIADTGKYWLYQYCRFWKILEKLYQYCRYWKILVKYW